jgi:hypothetical protein
MNGDWEPEWCWGLWNTGFGRGLNYRDRRGFHDVLEFAFNHTIEDGILDIPEYAGMLARGEKPPDGTLTPLQVADQLEAASKNAAAAVERVKARGEPKGELACCCDEFAATAALGAYYAEKIRGATELMRFFATNDEARQDEAVARLTAAKGHWQRFIALSVPHYRAASGSTKGCQRNLREVERDILIAQNAHAAPEELAKLGVLQRASQRPRFNFMLAKDLIEKTLVPSLPPLRQMDQVDLSPATCDVMVLGKEAWSFNDLPAEKKRLVVDAVEKGVNLVIFFQNFPKFDASWLPGHIGSEDKDADQFRWTGEHPIAAGVDPAALAAHAIVNDMLAGGDAEWKSITDPPGGLMIRQQGKGQIIFCQLDVLHRFKKDPVVQRLIRNIMTYASGGRKDPRIVLLDENTGLDTVFGSLKVPYLWLDELPPRK